MKKFLLTCLCAVGLLSGVQAQDVIMKRSGEKLEAKVLEITPSEIKYKRFESLEGPTYIISKNDVTLIQYANNTSETFEVNAAEPIREELTDAPAAPETYTVNMMEKGLLDANTHYDGYKAAGTGTLVASLISPLIGLIPAIACSATPPRDHNLDSPDQQLLQKAEYKSGYVKNARKIKSRKVWKNWGIGLGVNVVVAVLLAQ